MYRIGFSYLRLCTRGCITYSFGSASQSNRKLYLKSHFTVISKAAADMAAAFFLVHHGKEWETNSFIHFLFLFVLFPIAT